ncbi:uncharacterized protein LOC126903873 [Daktulosphaira vitifoliae]|uniref:uncharacterized protein LOC126903873 n=1 Tax=Daktulosphaira vitifoliae TaxID=58002 RepID=UPI0021AA9724|nr:uncharacterized protein LOC126903873 [Daktulosphaira vitifoliae]
MYNNYLFSFGLICIILNFDFVNSTDKVSKLNLFLKNPFWLKLRKSLHIIDESHGEIALDQLIKGITRSDFVTSENLNDKARQFYLLLSCNLFKTLGEYTDYVKIMWTECKKYPGTKIGCKHYVIREFIAFTNVIADWPVAFSSFSNYTEMELKNNINSYVDIVYYLASSKKHSDKDLDEKFDELDNNVRDFMNDHCRPKPPTPSIIMDHYNKYVRNRTIREIFVKVRPHLNKTKILLIATLLNLDFLHSKKCALMVKFNYKVCELEKFFKYLQWTKFRNGLHINDGNNGEITMDQLLDGFGTKDFVTSQNKNDKVRQFYLFLSCNFYKMLEGYTDFLRVLWIECKKHTAEKQKCKKQLIMEFDSFTNFIEDWPAAFSSFSNYTDMELKNNIDAFVIIVYYLASSNNKNDNFIDEKFDELYNIVRDYMNNNCRPIQPTPSKIIEWYNGIVERGKPRNEIIRNIKYCLNTIKISIFETFLKFGFWHTIKTVPKIKTLDL